MAKLAELFEAKSVAIIGASNDNSKAGHHVYKLLIKEGYTGNLYAVHPTEKEVLGRPCSPSLSAITAPVDLLVIAVSAKAAVSVIEEAATRGDVKGAVILSAGFAETATPEGIEAERRLVAAARKAGIRLFGPNCIGVANPDNKLNTGFAPGMKLIPGNVGYITQSGAFGGALMMFAGEQPNPLGFAKFGHVGNMCDISNLEILEYYGEDPKVEVVAMYMEGVRDGREFMDIAARVGKKKPVLVMKVGRSELGAKAALSHTGSLAGSDKVYESAFKQCGVIRLNTIEELTDGVKAVSVYPKVKGNRVCILTEAGGPGIVCTDTICDLPGVELAPVTEETRRKLTELLPPMAMICKPNGYIDMTAAVSPQQQADSLRLVLSDPNVDMVVLIGLPPIFRNALELAKTVVPVVKEFNKPVAVCFMRGEPMAAARTYFEENGVLTFDTPERAASALQTLGRASLRQARQLEKRQLKETHPAIVRALAEGRSLLEPEAVKLLEDNKVKVMPSRFVTTKVAAQAVAAEWKQPVALKIVSPQVIHKSDVGGVKVNLKNAEEVGAAYDAILANVAEKVPTADVRGMLVVPMAESGTELIIGVVQDPQFGATVMFGLGGIFVEVFKDVSFRIAPFDRATALEMIQETKAWQILQGVRGENPKDIDSLVELLVKVSEMAVEYPNIREIDLNPVRVYEQGVKILDARVMLNNSK